MVSLVLIASLFIFSQRLIHNDSIITAFRKIMYMKYCPIMKVNPSG